MTLSQASRPPSEDANPDWTRYPFRQFVLKLHGRCNLSCTYCYIYEMADNSWRYKPKTMSAFTLDRTADRIAEHASAHHLDEVEVVLHGGEPLLRGAAFIKDAVRRLRSAVPPGIRLSVRLQTNGTLLNQHMLDMLLQCEVKVGVSCDGPTDVHDARRRRTDGRGSYSDVAAALRMLATEPYTQIFSGILCTIDISADPVVIYESLAGFSPPRLDFLLPHANWAKPPDAGYGQWLTAVFDRWYERVETKVRLFEEIIHLLLGGHSSTEMIGLSPVALIVIDTDGSMEQVDTLKSAFPGAPELGMSIFTNTFDDALAHPAIAIRQVGSKALPDTCLACPIHRVCGGGYYPHRFHPANGFQNPSVYCADLGYLITHIGRRIRADLLGYQAC